MRPYERLVLDQVMMQLDDLRIDAHESATDEALAALTLRRGRSEASYLVELADTVRNRISHADPPASRTLAISDHIHPRTADLLRHAGVEYVDALGNASLEFGDVIVHVRGRRSQPKRVDYYTDTPRLVLPRASGNLFSAGRSQVVCALLTWPSLWHASARELASSAGVSVGLAHGARNALRDQGYDATASHADHRLLDLWAAAFPTGLARRLHLGEFRGDPERHPDGAGMPIYVGGEAAIASLLRPATTTLYTPELTPRLIMANRWRTDGPPNVLVRKAFWHVPDEAADPTATPWPLVYADLFTSEDPRLRDAAEQWRRSVV
jgi:hypothetical protein